MTADAGSPGQAHLDRRLVPDQRELRQPHARRRGDGLRGPADELRRPARARAQPPAPGAEVPPEAGVPAGPDRQAVLDRRSQLQPRLPRAPLRRCRRPAPRSSSRTSPAGSSRRPSTAPSRCGRCGSSRASSATASRSSRRPITRWSTASRESTSRPSSSTSSRCRSASRRSPRGCPTRRPRPRSSPRAGSSSSPRRRLKLGRRALRAASHPRTAARKVGDSVEALGEVAWNFTNPAPDVPLNVEIGSHRRFAWARGELDQYKRIKGVLGGTVNDVVLTVVSGALREWLQDARRPHRGPGAASARARVDPGRGRARAARQPDRGHARPAPRLRGGPGEAVRDRPRRDGRPEGLKAGPGRRGDLPLQRLRAADAARPGRAHQLLDDAVQPARHQRAGPADSALRARPRAAGRLPRRLPARRTTRWRSRS